MNNILSFVLVLQISVLAFMSASNMQTIRQLSEDLSNRAEYLAHYDRKLDTINNKLTFIMDNERLSKK